MVFSEIIWKHATNSAAAKSQHAQISKSARGARRRQVRGCA
jgi:hypothetical protein